MEFVGDQPLQKKKKNMDIRHCVKLQNPQSRAEFAKLLISRANAVCLLVTSAVFAWNPATTRAPTRETPVSGYGVKSFPGRKSNRQLTRRGRSCTCCKGRRAVKLNCDTFGGPWFLQIIRSRHPCFHAAFSVVCRPLLRVPRTVVLSENILDASGRDRSFSCAETGAQSIPGRVYWSIIVVLTITMSKISFRVQSI